MNRCGWSVHDVAAHLTDSALTTRFGFERQMVRARFDSDRANEEGAAKRKGTDPVLTLDAFRATADRTCSPPAPIATRLVEACVHGEDICRPLGIQHAYPMEPVMMALTHMVRTSAGFGGGRERARGLRLCLLPPEAQIGDGPEVRGEPIACIEPAASPSAGRSTTSSTG
ncbi:maleylpyruvate isomerase family mycothiol-dependent enzyme [Serinicoccus hydrothermalis]|uniref:maleylpyruvate isomerase family mycothiol-dependent enzyme n=1 Tax=Serinicoccus hydrothermalis TaxID=1758689 RepID=UPI0008368D6B|nr:maleylpyruvate isomerase family mycothiol-dependent enzyme [Serinicoccus hydrothermalis]